MCQHPNAKFQIVIERWIDAQTQISEICDAVQITRDIPQRIRVAAVCPDCDRTLVYAAYNPAIYAEIYNTIPHSVDKWPTWLLNRLIPLRARNAAVHEACLVCNVPPIKHASWSA